MIDLDFLRVLDRFNYIMKRNVRSKYQGTRTTQLTGSGTIFKDYREYIPGDDFRKIDWRVYARTDKFFIKRYDEERNLTLHIVLDGSASMNYGKSITKFIYGAQIGLGYSYIAMRNNEKFEFSTFSDRLNNFRPRKGKNQLVSIVDILSRIKVKGHSNFRDSLEEYKKSIKSKSMIVIISDFLYDEDELRYVLQQFRRSKVVCVQVLDPVELSFDVEGDLILEDMETSEKLRTYISRRTKSVYQDKLKGHCSLIQNLTEEVGGQYYLADTGRPVFESFFDLFKP